MARVGWSLGVKSDRLIFDLNVHLRALHLYALLSRSGVEDRFVPALVLRFGDGWAGDVATVGIESAQ